MARKESDRAKIENLLRYGKIVSIEPMPTVTSPRQPLTGPEFEKAAQEYFAMQGLLLVPKMSVEVGVGSIKKAHIFDLGSSQPPVLVECKCHVWTKGGNSPSAKLAVWNEAMYYFHCVQGYRKLFVVQRDVRRDRSLAEHYLSRYVHLVPHDVELWELDPLRQHGRLLTPGMKTRRRPTRS
jgi:hypothetical protein